MIESNPAPPSPRKSARALHLKEKRIIMDKASSVPAKFFYSIRGAADHIQENPEPESIDMIDITQVPPPVDKMTNEEDFDDDIIYDDFRDPSLFPPEEKETSIMEPNTAPLPPSRKSARVLHLKKERSPVPSEEPAGKRAKMSKDVPVKVKDEENESPTTITGLSEIELKMQRKIEERQKMLETLGIMNIKEELTASLPKKQKPIYRGIAREKKSPEPVVRRQSLRQRNLTPDGLELRLPTEEEVARAERNTVFVPADEHPRPPPGPAPLMDYYSASNREACEVMLKELSALSLSPGKCSAWDSSEESVLMTMRKMRVKEETVVKVVPNRIFSVQFHPSLEKTLVLVGGKWGELGVWDVGRKDETSGAYFFCPHSRPINCLTVDPKTPQYTYTTSYDGSLRRTDLMMGMVQEIYSLSDDLNKSFTCWHTQQDSHTFLVAASLGRIFQVDTRMEQGQVTEYLVHDRKTVKVITSHPTQQHYYATGSNDGSVCLWDTRHHKRNKPLDTLPHGRNITGLEFSSVTGNTLISTAMDDNLRFITCDCSSLKVERKIKHNNYTGRWLTSFKARFIPGREDLICVGSMLMPRQVEVWGQDGQLKHKFSGEALGSVSSVVALHPMRPLLAGCNSSGKVHVFQ